MADDQEASTDGSALRKQLEDTLAENKALKQQIEQAQAQAARESAFAKAGIPDSKLGELIRKSYDGPLEADAIRAYAVEVGAIEAKPTVPAEEREALLSLQSEAPTPRAADLSGIEALAEQVAKMAGGPETNEQIVELLRSKGLYAG